MELKGTKEILDALSILDDREYNKLVLGSIRKALNDKLVKPLRQALPYPDDKKAIRAIKDKEFKTGYFGGVSSDAFWLRFVEGGTQTRTAKKGNRGSITGKSTVEPFIFSKVDPIITYFNEDFGPNIALMMQRRLKRISK